MLKFLSKAVQLSTILLLLITTNSYAQGDFAGTKSRELIGKKYNNDRVLPGLPDYEYKYVTLASDSDDPEQFSVGVFQKGPTYVVFFAVNNDEKTDQYTILDVLLIKQVKKTQLVKTLQCRNLKKSDMEIVAVVDPGKSEYAPVLRAWRFNREKKKFELQNPKGVDCPVEKDE